MDVLPHPHFRVLARRLAQRRPTVRRQVLGLAADLDALALRGAHPAELDALRRWAEMIAQRLAEGRR